MQYNKRIISKINGLHKSIFYELSEFLVPKIDLLKIKYASLIINNRLFHNISILIPIEFLNFSTK